MVGAGAIPADDNNLTNKPTNNNGASSIGFMVPE